MIALRTQQIIAHESGAANVVDPLGGSYFIEKLTREMEEGAFEYFRKIDDFGGMIEAIDAGFPQREIQDSAYQYQLAVDCSDVGGCDRRAVRPVDGAPYIGAIKA